jgi:drug/metabolite transporter (DMT)-like permease
MKGYMAMTLVLFIWSGFCLSIRAIRSSALAPADVALLRFVVPIVILLPFMPGRFNAIKQAPYKDLLLILLGGVPFFFLASFGARSTPTAYVGTILAGTPPFFVAILSWCIWGQGIAKDRCAALVLILTGVLTMLAEYFGHLPDEIASGVLFLLCGSFTWALYTIGLKRIELDAISVTIVISIVSFLLTVLLVLTGTVTSKIGTFTFEQALPFIVIQGFCVGFLATIFYTYAVSQLGSARASTIGSLSPALTAFLAIPIFGESLSMIILSGVFLTITGVALSNRA